MRNFLKIFWPEEPLRKVANVRQQNRIANILNDIKGVGCTIQKDYGREGRGWKIVVDGISSDEPPVDSEGNEVSNPIQPEWDDLANDAVKILAQDSGGNAGWQEYPEGAYNGDLLTWDDTEKAWKQVGVNPSKGDILYHDGTQWAAMEIDTTEELDLKPHISVDNTDSANPRLKVSTLKVKLEVSGGKLKLATGTRGDDDHHDYGCPPKE